MLQAVARQALLVSAYHLTNGGTKAFTALLALTPTSAMRESLATLLHSPSPS
jgi:type VI protein secretion system component VasF